MAKYLVTGGAGFIGSNLVERLLEQGHHVRVLDNFSTGRHENLHAYLNAIEVIEGSITSETDCSEAVAGVDFVLHEGALPSVPRSVVDPVASHTANATGTLNMLVASRDAEVKRFVYASSSSVYGDTPTLPKTEDMPTQPLSPYAIGKLAGEQYCAAFYRLYGLPTIALRYFNVFGPRQHPDSPYAAVIPRFIRAILEEQAPVIYGDGNQSRDFTFVENVVQANLLACEASDEAFGQAFNCACGEQMTLNELVKTIGTALGRDVAPIHEAARKGDVQHSRGSIEKARRILGYHPEIGVHEGLRRTAHAMMA